MLRNSDLPRLAETIMTLLDDGVRRASMRDAARKLARPDAARQIARTLIEVAA